MSIKNNGFFTRIAMNLLTLNEKARDVSITHPSNIMVFKRSYPRILSVVAF